MKKKKKMCLGISKFYTDIVDIFSLIVSIIDKDYDYKSKELCEKSFNYNNNENNDDIFNCMSIVDKEIELITLKKKFNIKRIIKNISVREKYKHIDSLYKNKLYIEVLLLNNLYKKKYDFKKGKYIVVKYNKDDDKYNVDDEYKNFIEEIYNTYSIGLARSFDNSKPPLPKSKIAIPFNIWWNDYLKRYSIDTKISNPFKFLHLNIRNDDELDKYNNDVLISDSFRKEYNEYLNKFIEKKKR